MIITNTPQRQRQFDVNSAQRSIARSHETHQLQTGHASVIRRDDEKSDRSVERSLRGPVEN